MKYVALTLLTIGISIPVFSQKKVYVDPVTFRKIINRQFSHVVSGEQSGKPGNYATVESKDAKLSLNATAPLKFGLVSVNVNGAVTEGLAPLITNNRVNPSVGSEIKLHLLHPTQKLLRFLDSDIKKRDARLAQIEVDRAYKTAKYIKETELLKKTIANLRAKKTKIEGQLAAMSAMIPPTPHDPELLELLAKTELEIESASYKLATDYSATPLAKETEFSEEAEVLKEAARLELPLTGFGFSWLSVRYKFLNKNFYRFDSTLAVANQLPKQDFTMSEVGIEFNRYKWSKRPFETYFLTVGFSYSNDDNFDALGKREVVDTYNYGSTPAVRTSQKKYTAFQGAYEKNIAIKKFYIDFYYFLFVNNAAAVHIRPEIERRPDIGSLTNLGLGLLFPFKDKSDKTGKSIVNLEVYANLLDIENIRNKESSFFQRHDIGVRVSFPITFYNK